MSIASTDIVVYGAANVAEDDASTQGGAINTAIRYVFADSALANALSDGVTVVSDGADTRTVTITGRDSGGAIVSETLTLNGTTRVVGAQVFARILKIVLSASDAARTVTVTQDNSPTFTVLATLEPTLTQVRRLFYNSSADVSGGSAREYHEKIFVKNNHGTLSLLGAAFAEQSDPTAKITFALEDAVNDTGSVVNRLTAPATADVGPAGFDSASKTLQSQTDAGTADLAAGSAIGIWVKLTLAAGDAANNSTWTLRTTGTST